MRVYLRNMVCQGTKLLVIKELAKLGLKFTAFESNEIQFKNDLTLTEIDQLNESLKKLGLHVIFKNCKLVKEIREVINELAESDVPSESSFPGYITQRLGYSFGYLNLYFINVAGVPIEKYYMEKIKDTAKEKVNEMN